MESQKSEDYNRSFELGIWLGYRTINLFNHCQLIVLFGSYCFYKRLFIMICHIRPRKSPNICHLLECFDHVINFRCTLANRKCMPSYCFGLIMKTLFTKIITICNVMYKLYSIIYILWIINQWVTEMEKLSKKKSHWEGRILWKRTDGENQEQRSRQRLHFFDRFGLIKTASSDRWVLNLDRPIWALLSG